MAQKDQALAQFLDRWAVEMEWLFAAPDEVLLRRSEPETHLQVLRLMPRLLELYEEEGTVLPAATAQRVLRAAERLSERMARLLEEEETAVTTGCSGGNVGCAAGTPARSVVNSCPTVGAGARRSRAARSITAGGSGGMSGTGGRAASIARVPRWCPNPKPRPLTTSWLNPVASSPALGNGSPITAGTPMRVAAPAAGIPTNDW